MREDHFGNQYDERSPQQKRYDEYLICKTRGHTASGILVGDWMVCTYCGTRYRTVQKLEETGVPPNPATSLYCPGKK